MFYTRNGDNGQTTILGCCKKFSKSAPNIEALGALDELNSLLGVCKTQKNVEYRVFNILEDVQNDLFAIQVETAGADKKLKRNRTKEIEKIIDAIEKKLPKIKSFTISGGSELSALLDFSRAVARRVERRAVILKKCRISAESLKYLNRLSSLLFVLARFANKNYDIKEKKPKY